MEYQSFDESPEMRASFASMETDNSPRPKGSAWLAWLVIVVTIGLILLPQFGGEKGETSDPSIIMFEIQARYLVGASSMSITDDRTNEEQIQTQFGKGSFRQRLIGAVLFGERVGPDKSAKALGELETGIENGTLKASVSDHEIVRVLKRIQTARIENRALNDAFTEEEWQANRKLLPNRLGWVGQLALSPPGSPDREERTRLLEHARRTLFVILGVFGLAILAIACGVLLQIVWWIFAAVGRLNSGIEALRGDGAIYAETFAVWLALFMAINYTLMVLPLPKLGLVWVLIPQIGSLGALAWPVFRGLSWRDVRKDIGLSFGPQAWSAPFVGVAAYLSALPVVGLAMIVTLLMMAVASQFAGAGDATAAPIHPIVEPILRGNWTLRLQLMFVAVFAAVPEEIMFRGVLYRHLREAGARFGYLGSVAFATFISSFVFAVIHPQGLFGIPILMSLAIVFALVREWRGSLIPSIIAHALVNAGTSSVLLLIAD